MAQPTVSPKLLATGAAFVALAAVLGFLLGHREKPAPIVNEAREEVADTASVLIAVRALARIETVAYHMERIIDLKDSSPRLFGLIQVDDAIVLVAIGDVIAGVDLGKMSDGDITVISEPNAKPRVRLRLPAPEILSARLDNERTYVHSRNTDLWAQRGDQMESRARQLAERSIHDAAIEAGILDRARSGAEQALSALVHALGYEHIEFGVSSGT